MVGWDERIINILTLLGVEHKLNLNFIAYEADYEEKGLWFKLQEEQPII